MTILALITVPGYPEPFHTDQLDHAYSDSPDEWGLCDNGLCWAWVFSSDGYKMRCRRPRRLHEPEPPSGPGPKPQ